MKNFFLIPFVITVALLVVTLVIVVLGMDGALTIVQTTENSVVTRTTSGTIVVSPIVVRVLLYCLLGATIVLAAVLTITKIRNINLSTGD